MANVERRIEGFGHFSYDQAVYDELMRLSKAELVEMELVDTVYQRTAVRGLKKADLAVLVAHRETARREWEANSDATLPARVQEWETRAETQRQDAIAVAWDLAHEWDDPEPIAAPDGLGQRDPNEGIDEWHAFMSEQAEATDIYPFDMTVPPAEARTADLVRQDQRMTERNTAGLTTSDWTTQDGDQDFALGDVPELEYDREVEATNDADADAELISFMRTVVEAPSLPEFPVTETDVSAAEVPLVVQSGKELLWGKLISVVNRRTRFMPAFLVVVEFPDGIRRMVRADHTLAA